jgi:hypothetical protein
MRRRHNTQIAGQRASGTGGRARETPSPRRRRKCGVLTLVVVRRRRNLDLTSFVGTSSLSPCAPPCPLRQLPRAPPQRPRGASTSPPRTQRLGHHRPGSAPVVPERPSPYRRPRRRLGIRSPQSDWSRGSRSGREGTRP